MPTKARLKIRQVCEEFIAKVYGRQTKLANLPVAARGNHLNFMSNCINSPWLKMFKDCLEKQQKVKELFSPCNTPESIYKKIIEIGSILPKLNPNEKVPENLVPGCQSKMYLIAEKHGELIYFRAESDALISAGLAALMLKVYSGQPIETILKCQPIFLEEIGITRSLSPSRSNGLMSLFLKMKQSAIKYLN